MTDDLLARHAEEIRRVARRHGVVRLRVFGSHVEGTATGESDLDLLVDLEPQRDLLDLVAFKQDLEDLLRCKVDVVEEEGLSRIRVFPGRGRDAGMARPEVPGRSRSSPRSGCSSRAPASSRPRWSPW